jgi:predicted dehydrogenase
MAKTHTIGLFGCGDLLRWTAADFKASKRARIAALYDPDHARAVKWAGELGGRAVKTEDEIFGDPEIDIVVLFVPPWVRRGLLERAAKAGKHIITTKPLGPNLADCEAMARAVEKAGVVCSVFYRRTGNSGIETYKRIFDGGALGKLALYKQDWIHHYPQWNRWATDPRKNGGPFMDAMIHNMNTARYLMGRPATAATLFSDNHAQDLQCNDTEFMKLDFKGSGSAHLFITWAADLAVYSTQGNDREHIDITYMITDKGWRLTEGWENGQFTITASREGKTRKFVGRAIKGTTCDRFADAVDKGGKLPSDMPGIREACQDIRILEHAAKTPGRRIAVKP